MRRPSLFIMSQRGLGDCVFARPFIRAVAARQDLYLDTPWPEFFEDLPVKFTRPETTLRTQAKNVARQTRMWHGLPRHMPKVKLHYGSNQIVAYGTITRALEAKTGLGPTPYVFDLPDMGPSPLKSDKPIAFVRPVTVRAEWSNPSRNPLPEYVRYIAARLMTTHHVVVVADIVPGVEDLVGEIPAHHTAFLKGELSVRPMLALLRESNVAIGGVGWLVPASIALKTNAFIILGGNGAHNAPHVITDPRMDLSKISFAAPKEICKCASKHHDCNKTIPDLPSQWKSFVERTGVTV